MAALKSILEEITYPNLCGKIEITINDENILLKKDNYIQLYDNALHKIEYAKNEWKLFIAEWKADLIELIKKYSDKNVYLN